MYQISLLHFFILAVPVTMQHQKSTWIKLVLSVWAPLCLTPAPLQSPAEISHSVGEKSQLSSMCLMRCRARCNQKLRHSNGAVRRASFSSIFVRIHCEAIFVRHDKNICGSDLYWFSLSFYHGGRWNVGHMRYVMSPFPGTLRIFSAFTENNTSFDGFYKISPACLAFH